MPPPRQFLSLNIHDSLTFGGDVEICLHPDLGKFRTGELVEVSIWENRPYQIDGSSSTTSTPVVGNHKRTNSMVVLQPPPPSNSSVSVDRSTSSDQSLPGPPIGNHYYYSTNDDGSVSVASGSVTNNNTSEIIIPPGTVPSSPLLPAPRTIYTSGDLPPKHPGTATIKPPIGTVTRRANRKLSRHTRDVSDVSLETVDTASMENNNNNNNSSPQTNTSAEDLPLRRMSIVLLVTEASLTSIKGGRTQISILRQVADLYKLSAYDTVSIQKVADDESCHAEFLLVTFKDQFISRGDMLFVQKSLIGSFVYEGKRLDASGFQAVARDIRVASQRANSGLVTDKTTITFRSRSSRIIWLVQMSAEMWDYCSPYERNTNETVCAIYFDKWIQFVYKLFEKWKKLEASHSLTVVFFARSFLNSASVLAKGSRDVYGRLYEDHYRIVIDNETGPDWNALILRLKTAFIAFPTEVGWTDDNSRQPSIASRGNVLEAINVTLNLLQFHYLDRDLRRTGNSMVIVSAGNGVFEVDKRLASISYQRMMDNGIGSDVLSLALPALHIAPFFIYTPIDNSIDLDDGESQAQDYEIPHWMHLSFVSYESDEAVKVDRLIETKDTAKEAQQDNNGPVLNIGPHGFLMPRTTTPATKTPGSPEKAHTKQVDDPPVSPKAENPSEMMTRQLINGRDIRDILDACRPRDFSRLPSSLHALLCMKSHTYKKSASATQERFLEWGTMRFEANKSDSSSVPKNQRTMTVFDSSSLNKSALTPRLMFTSTDLASSQSSSFTGQFSAQYLNGNGTKGQSVLLQRSLSLDGENSVVSSDDEQNLSKDLQSQDDLERQIRERMLKRDRTAAVKYFGAQNELPTTISGISMSIGREMDAASVVNRGQQRQPSTASQRSNGQVGGIGASLVPFRSPFGGTRLSSGDRDFTTISRVNSMGLTPITARTFQRLNDTAGRGSSALLQTPSLEPTDQDGNAFIHHFFLDERQDLTVEPPLSTFQGDVLASSSETWLLRRPNRTPRSVEPLNLPRTGVNFSFQGLPFSSAGVSSSPPAARSTSTDTVPFRSGQASRLGVGTRKKRVLNPFRQQDEDEVLKTKSFNRRRWSHVFPRGEMEFKRHAGPNWKSLTAPAILPLGVDYFPSLEDLALNYTFSPYNVALESQDSKFGPKELMDAMVRQRLAQDYQLVSPDSIDPVNFRRDRHSSTALSVSGHQTGMIRHFLSMGYRMHVLTYDPDSDLVEVIRYESKHVRKFDPTFDYVYFSYCQETKSFTKVRQSFSKYADQYNWNRVDRLMCGAEDREIRDGMRFRRLMYGLIPPEQTDEQAEKDYVTKFHKLLEYLERMRGKATDAAQLKVKIVTSADRPPFDDNGRTVSAPNLGPDSMRRFYVQLRKEKAHEWLEVAIDSTFDTSWTYRIMFSWLVASSAKVEAQVQMLQRRCTNFQLELAPLPSVTTASNLFIQPFKAPSLLPVFAPEKSRRLDILLRENGYIHDDVRQILECLDYKSKYRFDLGANRGRQFVHSSGTLFVRILTDSNEASLLVVFGNNLYLRTAGKDVDKLKNAHEKAYSDLAKIIDGLVNEVPGK